MLELNKLETLKAQLNENEVKRTKIYFSQTQKVQFVFLTYIKPKFKIWGLNYYLGQIW